MILYHLTHTNNTTNSPPSLPFTIELTSFQTQVKWTTRFQQSRISPAAHQVFAKAGLPSKYFAPFWPTLSTCEHLPPNQAQKLTNQGSKSLELHSMDSKYSGYDEWFVQRCLRSWARGSWARYWNRSKLHLSSARMFSTSQLEICWHW